MVDVVKKIRWTESEINFLKENYSYEGLKSCTKKLNRSKYSTYTKAKSLNLRVTEERSRELQSKSQQENNLKKYSPREYLNPKTSEVAYFLGYFWADGNLIKRNTHKSSISLVCEDADYLYSIIKRIKGNVWNVSDSTSSYSIDKFNNKKQVKNQKLIKTYSIELFSFLEKMDFGIKSKTSFKKIFNVIPKKLKSYFILGYFDGDGCITIYKNKGRVQFSSTYDYDWSEISKFLLENNIEFRIGNKINKNGKCSLLTINKQKSLIIFYDLIYKNHNIGLFRKRSKFEKHYNYLINKI